MLARRQDLDVAGANHPLALTSTADKGTCARVDIPLHTAVGRTEP